MDVVHANNTDPADVKYVVDWYAYHFAFVTKYRPSPIFSAGIKDYVYQIVVNTTDVDKKGFQGFWGAEPFKFASTKSQIPQWDIDHIRVHYPAEHTFMGV